MNNEDIIVSKRKLTPKERFDYQVKLYAPCECGSGKKFKFCCRDKVEAEKSSNTLSIDTPDAVAIHKESDGL
jgi:hypothetical protein